MPYLEKVTASQSFLIPSRSPEAIPPDSLEGLFAANFTKLDGMIQGLQTAVPVLPATTGAPSDSPAAGTVRFDATAGVLYVYDGAAWKSSTLT